MPDPARKIPADIAKKARLLAGAWAEEGLLAEAEIAIATALLAERERCARIIEEWVFDPKRTGARADQAAAIRGGEKA